MVIDTNRHGARVPKTEFERLLNAKVDDLCREAADLRDISFPQHISYSRKVFIPLTKLCRDVCHYCTFAQTPKAVVAPYLSLSEVVDIARRGAEAGCTEALLTLGDKPELRYAAARDALADMGYATTVDYLVAACRAILDETGLMPHVNPGVLSHDDLRRLREVSASAGIMLESASPRLLEKGQCHHGSPDKDPAIRLATLRAAGELKVPFTTGILIGIGETRRERLEALAEIAALDAEFGHIQEVIVQNFRAKAGTLMVNHPEPDFDDLRWTVAAARILLGPEMNIQVPPNLSLAEYPKLIEAGINDWGGISPVTPDHVNPEAAWPQVPSLASATAAKGKVLVQRLPSYPEYVRQAAIWHAPEIATRMTRMADAEGYARADAWAPGTHAAPPELPAPALASTELVAVLDKAAAGHDLNEADIVRLFEARGGQEHAVFALADQMREERVGDRVTYVINRNINYTNVCKFSCSFCAFSKGQKSDALRGRAYDIPIEEVERRSVEAWGRGATEVCLQGGIHPDYSGDTYLSIVRAIKEAVPAMHVHAFSPLEVSQGASEAGLSTRLYLEQLKEVGLGTLPGTAAEILDDDIRALICPDKLDTATWLHVIRSAHETGLRTTATIMFGHVEGPEHWARHLIRIRGLQAATGGFTEFVPLPFVHTEAPMHLRGQSRLGPTFREAMLMHAVARIVFYRRIDNIQVSWVKMGEAGVAQALRAGVNDLGGTLMNESISRAAGTVHGQEWSPSQMQRVIRAAGREPIQRGTAYGAPQRNVGDALFDDVALTDIQLPAAGKTAAIGSRRQKRKEQFHEGR